MIKTLYICIKAEVFLGILRISEYVASQFYRYQCWLQYPYRTADKTCKKCKRSCTDNGNR